MNNPRVQLQQVQQLLAEDHADAAAEILASVAHPMTQIWLDHLKGGGRDRLLLQESLLLHADDPRLAEAQARIERNDLEGATAILSAINHPMTEIWLRHLQEGGRERLMMPDTDTAVERRADTTPQPVAAPAPVMDARMRRILELQQSPQLPESPPPVYRTDPILTLTPPQRNGWRAVGDHWRGMKMWHRRALGVTLLIAIVSLIASPSPFGPLSFVAVVAIIGMVRFSTVTISIQTGPQGELVWEERAMFKQTEIWRYRLQHDPPLLYSGPRVTGFQAPPAALALNTAVPDGQAVGHPDAVQAYTIVKMALFALWATGNIMICQQQPVLTVLGMRFYGRKRYILRPVGMTSAGATVEDRIWAALAITPTVGRTVAALARTVLANPRQIVQVAENEAVNSSVAKRGLMRRRAQFDATNNVVASDTHQLLTLHANVMLYHAPIYRLISDSLARTARVLPVHNYTIGKS